MSNRKDLLEAAMAAYTRQLARLLYYCSVLPRKRRMITRVYSTHYCLTNPEWLCGHA